MSWLITGSQPAPVDPVFNNVSLLLHGDGANGSTTITDSSSTPKTVAAVGNAQISTAQSKFGGASIAFDGAGDYLTLPSGTAFQFGTGDFTVETWARLSTTSDQHNTIITTGEAEISTGFSFQRLSGGELNFRSEGDTYSYNSSISVPIDAWTHLAASRGGGTVRLFIDGVVVSSGVLPVNLSDAATLIGYRNASYNGYLKRLHRRPPHHQRRRPLHRQLHPAHRCVPRHLSLCPVVAVARLQT